ncbi:MAG: hypothetical protein OEV44_10175 [Spirochaetota bacterium]|nr:hypothetical protein [Spirochaetota bacterium]
MVKKIVFLIFTILIFSNCEDIRQEFNWADLKINDATVEDITRKFPDVEAINLNNTRITNRSLFYIGTRSKELTELYVNHNKITDGAFSYLINLKKLTKLSLAETPITDVGLSYILKITSLKELNLNETAITDNGMKSIEKLSKLEKLKLLKVKISDKSIKHLKTLKFLEFIDLTDTNITDKGVAELQKALPECKIKKLEAIKY